MKSSLQIHNELRDLDLKIAEAQDKFNAAEGDAKDAYRDAINQFKGEQKSLNDMLGDVLAAEDEVRRGGGVPLASAAPAEYEPVNAAQDFLGDPSKFTGLTAQNDLNVMRTVKNAYTEFGIGTKTDTDYNFPRQTSDIAPLFGILSTLPTGTTDADVLSFFVPDADSYTNGAKAWKKGETKGQTSFLWKKVSAQLETLAHYIPVTKLEMMDYGQLASLINTELLYGLRAKLAEAVVAGETEGGIIGITKADGVQKYTAKTGDSLTDSVFKMANDVRLASGFIATHVAMHPYVSESIQLEKDKNGRYINQIVNGKLFALSVVDDANLVTVGDSASTYGMAVYYNNAATVFTKHSDEVSIGLVNDQFVRNEYTILAEGTHGLKIARPNAFSVLADTGVTGR